MKRNKMRIVLAFAFILLAQECWSATNFNTHKSISGDDEPSKDPPTGPSGQPQPGSNPDNSNDGLKNPSPSLPSPPPTHPEGKDDGQQTNTELSLLDTYLNGLTLVQREDPRFNGKFFLVIGPNKMFERRHKNNTVWISINPNDNGVYIRTTNGTVTITDSALTVGVKVHLPLNETEYDCMHTARLNLAPVQSCTGMLEVVVLKPPSDWTSGCGMGYQEKSHDFSMRNWQQREHNSGYDSHSGSQRGEDSESHKSSGHFSQFSSHRGRTGTKLDNKQSDEEQDEQQPEKRQPQLQKQWNESNGRSGRKNRRQRKEERKQLEKHLEKHGQFNQGEGEESWKEEQDDEEDNFSQKPFKTHRRKSRNNRRNRNHGHHQGTEAMTDFLATFHIRDAKNQTRSATVHSNDLDKGTRHAVHDIEKQMFHGEPLK